MKLEGKIFYLSKLSFKYEGIIKICPQGTASEGLPHKNPNKNGIGHSILKRGEKIQKVLQ